MKVKIPEPVGPIISFYDKQIEEEFTAESLEKLLGEAESELDKICDDLLNSGKIAIFERRIEIQRKDTSEWLCFISGSSNLMEKTRAYSVRNFQREYKEEFKRAKEKLMGSSYPLSITISVYGSRDAITSEIDAPDTFKKT